MKLIAIILVLALAAPVGAQTPGLSITVLKGENGTNSIKTRTGVPIEIEVRDPKGAPVAGAQVIFTLPSFGASGSFPGGSLTSRTTTGPSGQAVMTGFVPNDITGRFNIKITADSGTLNAQIVVAQTNIPEFASEKPKSRKGLWIAIAAAAAGGGAAAAFAGGGGSKTSTAPPPPTPSVTIGTGAITVGGPR